MENWMEETAFVCFKSDYKVNIKIFNSKLYETSTDIQKVIWYFLVSWDLPLLHSWEINMNLLTKSFFICNKLNLDSNYIPSGIDIVNISPCNMSLEYAVEDVTKSNIKLVMIGEVHVSLEEMREEILECVLKTIYWFLFNSGHKTWVHTLLVMATVYWCCICENRVLLEMSNERVA